MENKKSKEVLIIEDDKYTNELIANTLKLAGLSVVCTSSGEEAMEQLKKSIPDLIVLDLLLPGIDGWEVCRLLRVEGSPTRKIPIVIASVISRHDIEASSDAMGILSFFNKPFEPTELIGEVERILGKSE